MWRYWVTATVYIGSWWSTGHDLSCTWSYWPWNLGGGWVVYRNYLKQLDIVNSMIRNKDYDEHKYPPVIVTMGPHHIMTVITLTSCIVVVLHMNTNKSTFNCYNFYWFQTTWHTLISPNYNEEISIALWDRYNVEINNL